MCAARFGFLGWNVHGDAVAEKFEVNGGRDQSQSIISHKMRGRKSPCNVFFFLTRQSLH